MRVLAFFTSMFLSFLPERYRRRWPVTAADLCAATVVSGILQTFLAGGILIAHFVDEFNSRAAGAAQTVINFPGTIQEVPARLFVGIVGILNFILDPLHMLLAYLAIEGPVRFYGATITEQALATLPLTVVAAIHTWLEKLHEKRQMGPPIVDEVQRGGGKDYDLRILSCRPKPDWNTYITVEFEEQFYQLIREARTEKPRPYIYYLRKNPPWRLVVVIRHYNIDDVLKK